MFVGKDVLSLRRTKEICVGAIRKELQNQSQAQKNLESVDMSIELLYGKDIIFVDRSLRRTIQSVARSLFGGEDSGGGQVIDDFVFAISHSSKDPAGDYELSFLRFLWNEYHQIQTKKLSARKRRLEQESEKSNLDLLRRDDYLTTLTDLIKGGFGGFSMG